MQGGHRLRFLKLTDNDSGLGVLINTREIEAIEDEGGPTTIVFKSGRTLLVSESFAGIHDELARAGNVI